MARATDPKPAMSDTRVPQTMRESTSRPTLSVPMRWERSGLARVWPRSCLSGSYGEITGAKSAATIARSITTTPSGPKRVRAACRRTVHRRARSRPGREARAMAAAGSAISDPGIDPAIEQVHGQVAQDEAHRDAQDHALHQWIVAREYRVHHEAPHPGQGEHVLGDHCSADQRAELEAEHGDDRDEGVLEHVATDDARLRKPLGPRGTHVVLRERVEHARTQGARDHGGEGEAQSERGQDERAETGHHLLEGVDVAGEGEPAQLHPEEEDQEKGQEKVGHADAEERERRPEAVHGRVAPGRRENAERGGDYEGDGH